MKKLIASAAITTALISSVTAHAEVYSFNYSMLDGTAVTGTFNGSPNGNLVTGLNHISVYVNGVNMTRGSPLEAYSYNNLAIPGPIVWEHNAVVSFDARLNNFIFADSDAYNVSRYFAITPLNRLSTIADSTDLLLINSFHRDRDPAGIAARWSLSVSAVPEPETYGMLLAGLGLVGFAARRRAKQA